MISVNQIKNASRDFGELCAQIEIDRSFGRDPKFSRDVVARKIGSIQMFLTEVEKRYDLIGETTLEDAAKDVSGMFGDHIADITMPQSAQVGA